MAEDCERCGALLPEDSEGICPTCGSVYGKATAFMPQVTPEMIASAAAEERPVAPPSPAVLPPRDLPAQTTPAPASRPAAPSPKKFPLVLILIVLGAALAVGVTLGLVLLR